MSHFLSVLRWRVAGVVLLVGGLAACGAGADQRESPSSSPSREPEFIVPDASEVSQKEAMSQIPLEGTDDMRLHWRMPDVLSGTDQAVLKAARHYIALRYASRAVDDKQRFLDLIPALSTGRDLRIEVDNNWNRMQPEIGPVWLWAQEPQRDDQYGDQGAYSVEVCVDLGWHAPVDEQDDLPRPGTRHANVSSYSLVKTPDDENQFVWRVFEAGASGANPKRGGFAEDCADWADHKPTN